MALDVGRVISKSAQFGMYGLIGCVIGALLSLLIPQPKEAEEPPPPKQLVDIMFVLDVTGSMNEEIDGVRKGISEFVRTLSEPPKSKTEAEPGKPAEAKPKSQVDVRVGLLAFSDRTLPVPVEPIQLMFDGKEFTSDTRLFGEEMRKLKADGGGDEPESSPDALVRAFKSPWRSEAQKVVILITDAPPQVPDKDTPSIAAVRTAYEAAKINQLHVVVQDGDRPKFEDLKPTAIYKLGEVQADRAGFSLTLPEVAQKIAKTVPSMSNPGKKVKADDWLWELLSFCGLTGLMAIGCFLALVTGQNLYLRRPLVNIGQLALGLPGTFAAGVAAGVAGFLIARSLSVAGQTVQYLMGWGALGGLLGLGIAMFVPNMKRGRAFIGGALGGALAVLALYVARMPFADNSMIGGVVGLIAGAAILGLFIGLVVALVEAAFREAWLEVAWGPKEIRQVSLGKEPITVGGDRGNVTIYIHGAPAQAFRYRFGDGQVMCEDLTTGYSTSVPPGDRKQLGKVTVTVCTSGVRSSYSAGSPSPAAPPPPAGAFSIRVAGGRPVLLTKGVNLTTSDVPGLESQGRNGIVAEVASHPKDPSVLGLKNLSHKAWSVTMPSGEEKKVEQGRSVSLARGVRIKFGNSSGEIL